MVVALAAVAPSISHAQSQGDSTGDDVTALKKLSLEDLLNVEVTSVSKRPERISDAASAIQVITNDEIVRSGTTSLPEALRIAGNLDVAQRNPHDWNVSARGFNTDLTNKMLVLIDGRSVYTPLFSGVFWDAQDYLLEDIDRIEVVSGPGGTLWGANAVNGVINVTTKNARDTQGLLLESTEGAELNLQEAARYGLELRPGVYARVYGKYTDYDQGVLPSGQGASDGWRMGRTGFRMDVETQADDTITAQGDYYAGHEGVVTGGTSWVDGENLVGRWSHRSSPESDFRLQLYFDRAHVEEPKPANPFEPAGVLRDSLDTYDLDFQHDWRIGFRNKLVWGAGVRLTEDRFVDAPTVALVPSDLNQILYSGFAQDEVSITDDTSLVVGSKFEHNSYTGVEIEPNVRVSHHFADTQMVWGAVSRAVRTPSRVDRDLIEPTGLPRPLPQSILTGNPDFRSESVVAYEAGYRGQAGARASVSFALFYNDYDHVRSTTPGPSTSFGLPIVFENNLDGDTYGFELSGIFNVADWWRIRTGFDLLKEHIRVKSGAKDFTHALNETADPQAQFTLRPSFDLPHRIQLDSAFRWVDTRHTNNGPTPGEVPSYVELDVRIGWKITKRLEVSVVGQNLLHGQHPEYGFPSPLREEIERSVYAKALWRY